MTADDIIFTYYVFADPSYVGPVTLSSYSIIGLKNYQTQTSDEVYTKYDALFDTILAAGSDHVWAATDAWTQEQQTALWDGIKTEWKADLQAITDYVIAKLSHR